ncbi:MAG: hypothetical protein AAGI22_27860 [Planctomycetota bacterium]
MIGALLFAIAPLALLGAQGSSGEEPVDAFVAYALGLEHLTDYRYGRGHEELERLAACLSTGTLVELLEHEEPRVRAVAIVGLHLDRRISALPEIAARIDDHGAAPPRLGLVSSNVPFSEPFERRYHEERQSVSSVARSIVSLYLDLAPRGFRFRSIHSADRRHPSMPGFDVYWAERAHRETCLGWLTVDLRCAVRGSPKDDPDAIQRVAAVRRRIEAIDDPYRSWLLLALAAPGENGWVRDGGALLADEERLLQAGRAIGAEALMRFLSGEPHGLSDPDCALGEGSRFPSERIVPFLLRNASDLLPGAAPETLLELEARHLAGDTVGLAPRLPLAAWSIAAAELSGDGGTALLVDALERFSERDDVGAPDQRAFLAMALWRHGGVEQLERIVDWFFAETPRKGWYSYSRARVAWGVRDESWRPVLRAVSTDDRVSTLDRVTFHAIVVATNSALGRVVEEHYVSQNGRAVPAAESIEQLRAAW